MLLRPHSEPLALLRGDVSDERQALIRLQVQAVTFQILNLAIVAGFLIALARGHAETSPFVWLGALSGTTLIVTTLWFRRRASGPQDAD